MVNMNDLMKQAQSMQEKMKEAQEEMAKKEYEGVAGGELVKVKINGKTEMLSVEIDPSMKEKEEIEVLQDLIVAAFNNAKKKADEDSSNSMSEAFGGMMPPGMKFPF
jgi:DNA-binding YbaB/EbfC family protein